MDNVCDVLCTRLPCTISITTYSLELECAIIPPTILSIYVAKLMLFRWMLHMVGAYISMLCGRRRAESMSLQ